MDLVIYLISEISSIIVALLIILTLELQVHKNNNFYQLTVRRKLLWKRSTVSGSDWVAIDKVKGQGDEDYSYGWKYKNDTTQIGVEYNSGDWTTCKSCLDNRNTNNIAGSFYEVDTDEHFIL